MAASRIGFILPTYGAFDYARLAAQSFLRHTPGGHVILIDDASRDWNGPQAKALRDGLPRSASTIMSYGNNGGLTRSWNAGLRAARDLSLDYVLAGNSDLLFVPGWFHGLLQGLETYRMVGPITNAPGVTARGLQEIKQYYPQWKLTDDPRYLAMVSAELQRLHKDTLIESECGVNGFAFMSRLEYWWEGAFDSAHVFNPDEQYRMTRNEDELQGRWRRLGWPSVVVPASLVFHYRSVSRGSRHRRDGWWRIGGRR